MTRSYISRVFRFAPSPNGYLHLGHGFSALLDQEMELAAAFGAEEVTGAITAQATQSATPTANAPGSRTDPCATSSGITTTTIGTSRRGAASARSVEAAITPWSIG